MLGDKVDKTESSVVPGTGSLFWETNRLYFSKCTKMTEEGIILLTSLLAQVKHVYLCARYQKSSRSSLTEAWKGMLRTRILVPVCFFPTCFFLPDTSVFL